jgi:hypothetical protein
VKTRRDRNATLHWMLINGGFNWFYLPRSKTTMPSSSGSSLEMGLIESKLDVN